MARKLALIIGNGVYEDQSLAKLKAPDIDVSAFSKVLEDPQIGHFDEVIPLRDEPSSTVRKAIAQFFNRRRRDDLLLLYFSGHGVKDGQGHLHLAVRDTELGLLSATAVEAAFITAQMDDSASRRQVLILDCCYSGAFSRGSKGALSDSVDTAATFRGSGYGRVVFTATDATQLAWEGDQVIGEAENSLFTHYLLQGLTSGKADSNRDGQITIDELYRYVYEQVVTETSKQKPGKWAYNMQGEIVIASAPPISTPGPLPTPGPPVLIEQSPRIADRSAVGTWTRHMAPAALLALVFAVNWIETALESRLEAFGLGSGSSYYLANAVRWFEYNISFEYHDVTNNVAAYGYSIAYFFLLPALGLGMVIATARRSDDSFKLFSLALAIDYLVSLPFFLFFPVPERWAFPDSGAMLLSDKLSSALIDAFRPISGLNNCFPSYHTSMSVIIVLVAYALKLRFRASVLCLGVIIILATFVLGIHWVADIVAGIAVGILSVSLAKRLTHINLLGLLPFKDARVGSFPCRLALH